MAAINLFPSICHMNEGRSAFSAMERLALSMERYHVDLKTALQIVPRCTVFTTHTPVAAGYDSLPIDLVKPWIRPLKDRLETDELKSNLTIVNVINQRDVDALMRGEMENASFSTEKFVKDSKKDRLEQINQIIKKISAKHIPIKVKIKIGIPFREIVQTAKDNGVDLVVMGRKGRGNLAGILFGTTAEKMFRHCPVPLLSLRKDMQR